MTPSTSAIPIPIGKATAKPAMSMAATRRMLARLNTIPPAKANRKAVALTWLISAIKERSELPILPIVNAIINESRSTPIE